MARKSMSQTERQEDKVAENASNKRKWEGHYKNDWPVAKNKTMITKTGGTGARVVVVCLWSEEKAEQDLNNIDMRSTLKREVMSFACLVNPN
ncbi:hypothetical protein Tco_1531222 [Tanacetum coccineum]